MNQVAIIISWRPSRKTHKSFFPTSTCDLLRTCSSSYIQMAALKLTRKPRILWVQWMIPLGSMDKWYNLYISKTINLKFEHSGVPYQTWKSWLTLHRLLSLENLFRTTVHPVHKWKLQILAKILNQTLTKICILPLLAIVKYICLF